MKGIVAIVIAIAVIVVAYESMYTINPTEQVIITQFGEPRGEVLTDPGLHFKTPFIQKVNSIEARWLEWDGEVDEMRTAEKTPILVDTFARWRIKDALTYFKRLRTEQRAQSRLDDIIESETRNVLAANRLIEIVRSTKRELPLSAEDAEQEAADVKRVEDAQEGKDPAEGAEAGAGRVEEVARHIMKGRFKLTREILAKVETAVPDFGIEVVDLQFQRVNYTSEVEKKAFERMISERKRIAARYRSEGQGESAKIQGKISEDLQRITSEAYRSAEEIKGTADAEATAIYAAAHNLDPELYRLLKSLESYEGSIDDETWVIMSTDSDYFRALKSMR